MSVCLSITGQARIHIFPSPMITRNSIQTYLHSTFKNRKQKSGCRHRSLMTKPEATEVRKPPERSWKRNLERKRKTTLFWVIMCILVNICTRVLCWKHAWKSVCINMQCGEGTFMWPLCEAISLYRRNWFCHHTLQHPCQDIRERGGYLLQALQTAEATGIVVAFDGALVEQLLSSIYSPLLLFIKHYLYMMVVMSMQSWKRQRQANRSLIEKDKEDGCPYDYSNKSYNLHRSWFTCK